MKAWKHTLLAALLLCPVLAAGAASATDAAVETSRMETPALRWQLQQLYGNKLAAGTERPYLQMSPPGRLSGYGGCNQLNGAYLLEGRNLSFAPVLSTRISCNQDQVETDFLRAMGESRYWRAEGDLWLLLDQDGRTVAVLQLQRQS